MSKSSNRGGSSGPQSSSHRDFTMVGSSDHHFELQAEVRRLAPLPCSIVIVGETGTGKELVARALHDHSLNPGAPFITVNCAALNEGLAESHLFGHVKGAFTSATTDKPGAFQDANGGTLFLDEGSRLTPAIQAKLLRALDPGEVQRVGTTRVERVKVRVLLATTTPLEQGMKARTFLPDLYYRLVHEQVRVAPLRERKADIFCDLAQRFAAQAADGVGRPHSRLSPEALDKLGRHTWPGNIRELKTTVERAVFRTAPGARVGPEAVTFFGVGGEAVQSASPKTLVQLEDEAIAEAMVLNQGNTTQAARQLGLNPSTLRRRAQRQRAAEQKADAERAQPESQNPGSIGEGEPE